MFPKQTDSDYRNIRNYGCLLMCYAWITYKRTGYNFTMREIEYAFSESVKKGFILDNDKPTDGRAGLWYRCWINNPEAWMRWLAASVKLDVDPKMLWKSNKQGENVAPYYIVENDHRSGLVKDSHFTARNGVEEYNPGVTTGLVGVKNYRGWKL